VVYVGVHFGTCLSRFHALEKLVSSVEFFSIEPYFVSVAKWRQRLEKMTYHGPQHVRANADLLAFCRRYQPEAVWVDKSIWVWPSTLRALRAQGVFLVHHFTDALFPTDLLVRWIYRLLRKTLPLYDLNFTSNIDDHAFLVGQRGVRAELTYLGYDAGRFDDAPLPPDLSDRWSTGLLFIGHHEPRTEQGILALVEAGLPVKVYGSSWHRARYKDRLRGAVQFKPLSDADYVHALKAARIGLCFVSEINHNQTAGRSFEIPACGTFLLAMRTPQHLECYQEGVEAEFFDNTDELVRKAKYYLENDEKRQQIAQHGHRRCIESDYSWERYTRDDWGKVLIAMNCASIAQGSSSRSRVG
jgi:glycosyltransferase involved in cell wall biosynthesis